jgi:NitT/TauT family transport system substrate-binding protein
MKIQSAIGTGIAGIVLIGIAVGLLGGSDTEGKIRVAYFPNIGHAVPIVGIEYGFFDDILTDIIIETRIFDSGPQAIESLFANAIDLAYVGPGPAVNGFLKSESKNIVIISGAASGGSSFIIHPNSDIKSGADLAGKKIAAPQIANTQDVSLRNYIAENGFKTAERGGSVYVLNVANPEIYTLFTKGDIDGAWVPEPWATILVNELGGKRLFHEESLWPEKRFASVLLVARADYVRENPQVITQWLTAHDKAVSWINANPDETEIIFNSFMQKELRTTFADGIIHESFGNIEITSDTIPLSISTFAERANSLGYLGREGYSLDGIFYDRVDVNSQSLEEIESWQS